MKLTALLKDSFREAVDRKIFAAMLVLSGLLILFVASISFQRITLEEELQSTTRQLSFFTGLNPHIGKATYSIENFQQTNDAVEPWKGDYRFDWVVKVDAADKLRQLPMTSRRDVKHIMRDGMDYLDHVEVSENASTDDKVVRFTITSRGTKVDDVLAWRHEPKVLFAVPLPIFHTSLREGVYFLENTMVGGLGAWVAVLVGIVVTASFIPNLLQKGSVELILSKPIRRPGLLMNKYIGGLVFVFLLTAFTVLGVWAAIGLRTGVWTTGFLFVIPAVTFYFALLYSISTLVSVFTRNAVVAILLTVAAWFGLWLNGFVHERLAAIQKLQVEAENRVRQLAGAGNADPAKKSAAAETVDADDAKPWNLPKWVYATSDFFYRVLPRTSDLNHLTDERVARGLLSPAEYKARKFDERERPNWPEVLAVTGVFISLMLGMSCWKFARTDY